MKGGGLVAELGGTVCYEPLTLSYHVRPLLFFRSRCRRSCRGTRLVKALSLIVWLFMPSAFYLFFLLQSAASCACRSV